MAIFFRTFWLARCFTSAFGMCSLAWALSSIPVYRQEAPLAISAQYVLAGENLSAKQLSVIRAQLGAAQANPVTATALRDVAVARLRLVENEMTAGSEVGASSLADLETAVTAALTETPTDSFLWLTEYWLQSLRAGSVDGRLKFLRMSYLFGPNEAWIAVRRNSLALSVFPSLPDELAVKVLSEFEGIVRSGLYLAASNILSGSGWAAREKLLGGLTKIKEDDRREFAKLLETRNVDGAIVPGVSVPSARPF